MVCTVLGPIDWQSKVDADRHREHKVVWRVRGETGDGPYAAMSADGLPTPGSSWSLLNDVDPWAFCQAEMSAKPDQPRDGERGVYFLVEQTFSTKNKRQCAEHKIEDPLLEPPKVSISTETKKEEARYDMFNLPINNSAHELIRGPQVEFEKTTSVVNIEQNVATFEQAFVLPNSMLNCVNDAPLWSLPPRCVRLADLSVDVKYYGMCNVYYTRKLKFAVNPNTWDRDLLDEGTRVLNGHWDNDTGEWVLDNIAGKVPDPANPKHFKLFPDRAGNPIRGILDGFGKPSGASIGPLGDYVRISNLTGGDLADTSYWIKQTKGMVEWVSGTTYPEGNVVETGAAEDNARLFIRNATAADVNVEPSDTGPGQAGWTYLPNWTTHRGIWNINTTYTIGDVVKDPEHDLLSLAGNIHLAYYTEASLPTLGIPLSL